MDICHWVNKTSSLSKQSKQLLVSSYCALFVISRHWSVAGDTKIKVFTEWWWFSDSENCMAWKLQISFSEMWQKCHPFVRYGQRPFPFTSKSHICISSLVPNNSKHSREFYMNITVPLRTSDLLSKCGATGLGIHRLSNACSSVMQSKQTVVLFLYCCSKETISNIKWTETLYLFVKTNCNKFCCSYYKKRNQVFNWSLK